MRTGAELTVASFFTDPTVAGIAAQVAAALEAGHDHDANAESALRVLLPIRAGGARPPVLCLPPMSGMPWTYAGLARFLPADQPIYGLQSPELTEPDYRPVTAAEIVRRYVDIADFHAEIREGFEALGITLPVGQDLAELDETALATLGEALTWDSAVLTAERIGGIYRGALRTVEIATAAEPGVFEGRVDYFRAMIPDPNGQGHGGAPAWEPHVSGVIEVHPIVSTHRAMTTPEPLAELGPLLAALLDGKE